MANVKVQLKHNKKLVEVASGDYLFCRKEAAKWLAKGKVFLFSHSHKYLCVSKHHMQGNYCNDSIATKQIY